MSRMYRQHAISGVIRFCAGLLMLAGNLLFDPASALCGAENTTIYFYTTENNVTNFIRS